MDPIRQIWSRAQFPNFSPPNVLYAFTQNGDKYIVISDNSTIYRLMNEQGQSFMVAHFRCVKDPKGQYYTCSEPLHIISCTKNKENEDQYAFERIIPLVFRK